jgi:formylmethanofuran--tetrahydromethanopterin N-formyltransferase
MKINESEIEDTFAEAWDLQVVRLLITAMSERLALGAALQITGAGGSCELGSSVQGGIERIALPPETPDRRPGAIIQLNLPLNPPYGRESFVEELKKRTLLSTQIPTCSIFDYMLGGEATEKINLYEMTSKHWNGYEIADEISGRKVYRVPITSGEFIFEKEISVAIGLDGHFITYADSVTTGVIAAEAAKEAIGSIDGVAPIGFGVEAVFKHPEFCPTIRGKVEGTKVPEGVKALVVLLMSGLNEDLMKKAMKVGIEAAVKVPGVKKIGAMNFGGEFGKHKLYLHELFR